MRSWALAAVIALGAGCGGGDSTPAAGAGSSTSSATLQDVAQDVLSDCALDTLQEYVDLIGTFRALLDAGESVRPSFEVTGIDLLRAALEWQLDLDADGAVDLSGSIRFTDASGRPTLPFDLTQLLSSGLGDLSDLLSGARDDTRVVIDYMGERGLDASGSFEAAFSGGLADTLSGEGTVRAGNCTGSYSLGATDFADLALGRYPLATLEFEMAGSDGRLSGTARLDGSSVAALDVSVNGGTEVFAFDVDLATGDVTPR